MNRWRAGIGLVILILSLISLYWGYWPVEREQRIQTIQPADFSMASLSSFINANPGPYGD